MSEGALHVVVQQMAETMLAHVRQCEVRHRSCWRRWWTANHVGCPAAGLATARHACCARPADTPCAPAMPRPRLHLRVLPQRARHRVPIPARLGCAVSRLPLVLPPALLHAQRVPAVHAAPPAAKRPHISAYGAGVASNVDDGEDLVPRIVIEDLHVRIRDCLHFGPLRMALAIKELALAFARCISRLGEPERRAAGADTAAAAGQQRTSAREHEIRRDQVR